MSDFLKKLSRDPFAPIDGASIVSVDERGNGYDYRGTLIAPKFEAPEQTWGETALGVLTAPQRIAGALYDSLTPYQFPQTTRTPMNRAGAGQPITGGSGDGGWQMPPIIGEGVNALTAVGDAYTKGMSEDEINSRALGMAGFMMGGGGLAAKSPVSRAANLFPDQPRAMSADLFAEAVPAGERFGARTAAADPRQSKHWPSWGDREPDRAAAHVREQEAADAWFSIVDPIMYDERGLKRMERHEAEALAIERFPDALDKGFAYKEAAKAWNEIDKGRPMTAAEQAWFDLDLAPGRARTSRNEIMRDIVMPNMIMPDGSTGVQHMAAANGPKKLYSNASKEGAASIYSGLLDRLSSAYAPDDQLNMFGGRNAKTANLERLAIAERLAAEGADRRAIWDSTGWFQGPDSKWRFEIDDSGSAYNPTRGATQVGHALNHPDLKAAYPDVPGVKLNFSQKAGGGAYFDDLDRIGLGNEVTPKDHSILLHELQHRVQKGEGFGLGGNARMFGPDEVAAERARVAGVADTNDWSSIGGGYGDMPDARVAEQMYKRLAGETEARNVQKRMNMSADERRATPPWETQDIPDIDQIVRLYSNASKEGAVPAIASALDMSPEASYLGYRGVVRADSPGPKPDGLQAYWMTDNKDMASSYAKSWYDDIADSPAVFPTEARFDNPLVVDADGADWRNIQHMGDYYTSSDLVRLASANKNDGVVINNVIDPSNSDLLSRDGISGVPPATVFAAINRGTVRSPLTGETLFSNASKESSIPAIAGALGAEKTPQNALSQSSKNANLYRFPELKQRPFFEDYPDASSQPMGAPLTHTMDGAPLRSEFVAGRQAFGGDDVGLGAAEIESLGSLLSDDIRPALAREIGNDAGRYVRLAGKDGPETAIIYRNDLSEQAIPRVVAHEIGHAIDDKAGTIPVDGLVKALRANYNSGTNASRGRVPDKDIGDAAAWAKTEGPEHHGYAKKDDINAELTAEALRAYLSNPNYIKSRYPELAARLRSYVNENPRIAKFIQLNANADSRPALLASALGQDDIPDWLLPYLPPQ